MRYWWISLAIYAAALAAGLLLPGVILVIHQPNFLQGFLIYSATALIMGSAALCLTLMLARVLFPEFWWIGQVLGQDVFEIQGVYFMGLRLTRVPDRLQRLLFGVGEKFRRWDAAFGIAWLLLLILHGLSAIASQQALSSLLPRQVRLPETMHTALLSDLPALRALGRPWSLDSKLLRQMQAEVDLLHSKRGKTEADWLRLAQLDLARAFKLRTNLRDPFTFSPSDRLFFVRGTGALAADAVTQILAVPEAKRAPLTRGAQTLLGFFYLCEYNYPRAERALNEALNRAGAPDDSGIPLVWTRLLAAQVALLRDQPKRARLLLAADAETPGLPGAVQALLMEHMAEALRLDRETKLAREWLARAGALYKSLGDTAGQARVILREASVLGDEAKLARAGAALSEASALAETARDPFTLNMVVRAAHLLPAPE